MEPQKTDVRVVAGSLKGRKVTCIVHEGLRPTPQMVREALFSILGNAVPDRIFIDIFSGTGIIGIEAISRGAKRAILLEKDAKLAAGIDGYLKKFGILDRTQVLRTDAYRWVERWIAPKEAVNCFLSPPFGDLTERAAEFVGLVSRLMTKVADDSCVVVQAEDGFPAETLPEFDRWDQRKYGRNWLFFWVKGEEFLEDADENQVENNAEPEGAIEP